MAVQPVEERKQDTSHILLQRSKEWQSEVKTRAPSRTTSQTAGLNNTPLDLYFILFIKVDKNNNVLHYELLKKKR